MERTIPIVSLSACAAFHHAADGPIPYVAEKKYSPFTLIPRNVLEHEALRCWITTHQSMFLTIGAAAGLLTEAIDSMEVRRYPDAIELLGWVAALRRASAAYTHLPKLDRTLYEGYLRPAMIGVRPAFSGVSSRESVEFAIQLKRLRDAEPEESAPELIRAIRECVEADRTWWQMHVGAMQRMVGNPISLAQQEFKRSASEDGLVSSYSEFLRTTLQVPEAMNDYDRFFGCVRGPLGGPAYLKELSKTLEVSDEYISFDEPFKQFRNGLSRAIPYLESLSMGRAEVAVGSNARLGVLSESP